MEEVKMLPHGGFGALWLLLLLNVSGCAFDFHLFKDVPEVREGAMRLFGSDKPWKGRVEVYHDGRWGTVCDDGWDMAEAQVVCRQLHFPGAISVVIGENYGQAPGPIWLDDVKCDGAEKSLFACDVSKWGVTDCTHKEDVGVTCESWNRSAALQDFTHSLDHSISLVDELGAAFDSGAGCDFLMVVQSPTGNKGVSGSPETTESTICAHKFILSQFPSFNTSEGMVVNVSLTCQPHFPSFVRYLYTRKIHVTFSSAQCLHWMASKFGMKHLMVDVGRMFTRVLSEDASFRTQVSLLQYATETGDLVLQENCLQYLAWNFQKLTQSPAWLSLSKEDLGRLLSRSDLVVPDEYFLLRSVESWVQEKGNRSTLEAQVELLNGIRFPMIPAEKLYQLEVNSSLYDVHKSAYREKMLKALQFNVLLFVTRAAHPELSQDDDYQPRIYTAEPWSTVINSTRKSSPQQRRLESSHRRSHHGRYAHHGYYSYYPHPTNSPRQHALSKMFSTPFHKSLLFKADTVDWEARLFTSQSECSDEGHSCDSVPAAVLSRQSLLTRKNVVFGNRLVLVCQGKYVCHVQEFKNNMAYVATNGSRVLAYPCRDEKYLYRFVVRPEFV
ncbi:galectin-3-binding protein A-like [Dunckerocampus dactyliophorus]|uniref:galectin-3-binding protein A-like n=1 Tax=Dunckerocampus dactyliophorus TaxID=161453 RepID=UPI002406B029|nr:galectin-3-binding protein A-like [Dunckerocampus dactyliophorus]